MGEHTQAMLEFAAICVPLFLACFGGIIAIYSRLTRIETKMDPIWVWWNERLKHNKSDNGGNR